MTDQPRDDRMQHQSGDPLDAHLPGAPPALRHGIYAETLLPDEDMTVFEELHHALVLEFAPSGALEHDIVGTLACLIWRKQNLGAFRLPSATYSSLAGNLDLENRLEALVDKCLKRLLFVRGVKSLASASASSPRLLAPSKAA